METIEDDEKIYWNGHEKIKFNLRIEQRHARNWTHYDIVMTDDNKKYEFRNRSECYACYSPPYPSHRINKKLDKKIEIEKLYKRLFHRQYDSTHHRSFNYTDTQVEIGSVKIVSEKGYPIKFELV